jgi:hypothetical protein
VSNGGPHTRGVRHAPIALGQAASSSSASASAHSASAMELEDGLNASGAGLGPAGGGSGIEGVGAGRSEGVGSPDGAAAEEDAEDAADAYGHEPAAAEPEQAGDGFSELSRAAQLCIGFMQPWAETLSEAHSSAGLTELAIPLRQGRIRSGRVAKRTGVIRMRGQRGPRWE